MAETWQLNYLLGDEFHSQEYTDEAQLRASLAEVAPYANLTLFRLLNDTLAESWRWNVVEAEIEYLALSSSPLQNAKGAKCLEQLLPSGFVASRAGGRASAPLDMAVSVLGSPRFSKAVWPWGEPAPELEGDLMHWKVPNLRMGHTWSQKLDFLRCRNAKVDGSLSVGELRVLKSFVTVADSAAFGELFVDNAGLRAFGDLSGRKLTAVGRAMVGSKGSAIIEELSSDQAGVIVADAISSAKAFGGGHSTVTANQEASIAYFVLHQAGAFRAERVNVTHAFSALGGELECAVLDLSQADYVQVSPSCRLKVGEVIDPRGIWSPPPVEFGRPPVPLARTRQKVMTHWAERRLGLGR